MKIDIIVEECGSRYRARWRGRPNFAFGDTKEQAINNLRGTAYAREGRDGREPQKLPFGALQKR